MRAELVAAVDGDAWTSIVARCIAQARRGDRHAREFLASYLLGKPRLMPVPVDSIKLGTLNTAADVAEAAGRVARAAAAGTLSLEAARELGALLETTRAAIETGELALRIQELEARTP